MATLDYTRLDRPEISMNSFYPRRNWTDTPPGAQDHTIPVGPDVSLSARFFPADVGTASILYFYGNGETAADYDDIALWYNSVGVNFFVVDYRGYGNSGGSPAFSTMLSDAWQALKYLENMLSDGGYRGGLFVMGRSMGRHAAFELAAGSRDGREGGAGGPAGAAGSVAGVIIESGRPTLGQFTRGLPPEEAGDFQAAYREKVRSIPLPVLVIHGEVDTLAPHHEAAAMHDEMVSANKRMLTIKGAGHNDLLYRGITEYFAAIKEFVTPGRDAADGDSGP